MAAHSLWRSLVRFGYEGSSFYGWARQPGARTVEGEIRSGLRKASLASSPEAADLEVASRTDRGVSARANALALSVPLRGAELLRALNGISPEILFSAATPIPDDFRVRGAIRRTYRYYQPGPVKESATWSRAAAAFQGRIDVRSFGRSLPMASPCWRDVEAVEVCEVPGGLMIELRARSFVWGMVRKIVGALREVESGRLGLTRLEAATRGEVRLTLPMAEPEGLLLWEVEYPFTWEVEWAGPNRHQAAYLAERRASWWRQQAIVAALEGHR